MTQSYMLIMMTQRDPKERKGKKGSWDSPPVRVLLPPAIQSASAASHICAARVNAQMWRIGSKTALIMKVARVPFCYVCKTQQCAQHSRKHEEAFSHGLRNHRYKRTERFQRLRLRQKRVQKVSQVARAARESPARLL